MINIIREIYRKQWTLDEFLAQAFRIDEYEIKSRVIKGVYCHLQKKAIIIFQPKSICIIEKLCRKLLSCTP